MIYKIDGIIDEINSNFFTVNVNNIYYMVYSTNKFIKSLENNERKIIYIYHSIKEASQALYGFKNKEERDFFEFMIGIRGLGEKTMLNILSDVSSEEFKDILHNEDLTRLTKLNGIGKKTGEKILLEIKNSIKSFDLKVTNKNSFSLEVINNSVEALVNLGINKDVAYEKSKNIYKEGMNVSDLVSMVLRDK